jgi:hypothetical protein
VPSVLDRARGHDQRRVRYGLSREARPHTVVLPVPVLRVGRELPDHLLER